MPFEQHLEVIRHKKMPPTHPFAFYPLIKVLHTQLRSVFFLCTSTNFKVLLTLIFLELISKINTFGADLILIGCIISEKH
jgi:hypothetical protein